MITEEIIRKLISNVNSTLGYFEKDYISVKRTPFSERERVETFEQYVEARFNYECCQIPELYDAEIATEGRLFSCIELTDQDISKRRFSLATIVLINPETLLESNENLINEINMVREYIGGSVIKFNNVKKKIKFSIED